MMRDLTPSGRDRPTSPMDLTSLCQPDHLKSCGACCGLYNHRDWLSYQKLTDEEKACEKSHKFKLFT